MIAVKKRQGNIQKHKVRRKFGKLAHNVAEIIRTSDLKPPGCGLLLYPLGYTLVILYDVDTIHLIFLKKLLGKLGGILDAAAAGAQNDARVPAL